jgi:hypothetical protein
MARRHELPDRLRILVLGTGYEGGAGIVAYLRDYGIEVVDDGFAAHVPSGERLSDQLGLGMMMSIIQIDPSGVVVKREDNAYRPVADVVEEAAALR